jgi:hypothetical protein
VPRFAAILLLLALPLAAQIPPALDELRQGKLADAVARLDEAGAIAAVEPRLETAGLLVDLATEARADDLKERALAHAARLVDGSVPDEHRARQDDLCVRANLSLAALLAKAAPGTDNTRARVRALGSARDALIALGRARTPVARDVDLELLPLLVATESWSVAVEVGEQALAAELLSQPQQRAVRGMVGLALLRLRKLDEAIERLEDHLASAPSDPEHVLGVVDELPMTKADAIFRFVRPVIADTPAPRAPSEAWTRCLRRAYEAIEAMGTRIDPGRSILERNTLVLPLPAMWGQRTWASGYRVWRPDNVEPGKSYAGRHALEAALPLSHGWRQLPAPPAELRRWSNAALCFHRAPDGPTLVVYWFAPDLHYWYGTTPPERGVTGKTARGHSRGGIASLVADIAYGEDAQANGVRYRSSRPLPFKPAVGSCIRKQWRLDDELFDETFFSIGQVTVEVLLRVRERDVEALEPELRWLYGHVRDR